jgi:hypothetical protein
MTTPIYREPIKHKAAWLGSKFRSVDEFAFDLTSKHVAALERILSRLSDTPRDEIRRDMCGHPDLDGDLAKIFQEIQHGRGLVLLRGFPVGKHAVEDTQKMWMAFCSHLGIPLSQNCFGERLVLVREERPPGEDQSPRGNKARQELAMHTDIAEIVALLCVREAKTGGESQLASALSVHNEILATRPEVLPTLYKGFPYHRRGEQPDHQSLVTPYDVPIFSNVDGNVSVNYVRNILMAGLHELGRKLSDEELEAVNLVRDVAKKQQFEFRTKPGEAYLVNNFTVLHSRSEFSDWDDPSKKRLMFRVWLEAIRDRRPVVPEIHIHENEGGRHGVDPVPGRTVAKMEYHKISESARKVLLASNSGVKAQL